MTTRKQSKAIKKRFVQAVEMIAQENYPKSREVDIIKSIGFTPANYYRLRATENNYPTLDQCVQLCTKYRISAAWLLLNSGKIRASQVNAVPKPADMIREALVLMDGKK